MSSKSNKLSLLKRDFYFYLLFLPLKRNGVLFLAFSVLSVIFIKNQFYTEESSFRPYLELFAWITGTFTLLVIGLGFFYTLICWVYLLVRRNKISPELNIGLEDGQKGQIGKVAVRLSLSQMLMPLIGYIKMRVVLSDGSIHGPVILNTFARGWKDLLPKEGHANLWLTDRKQYDIEGFVVTVEDYLQFLSFSVFKRTKRSFYLYPPTTETQTEELKPTKSQEMVERIKTSRRIEGDYLNYKDFESGDDVRRIVWKIFAKNKELVVRVPEVINPYASHIYFYGSFYNIISPNFVSKYSKGMLNYYKDIIYNVCLSLEKDNRKVQFNLDQPVSDSISVEKKDEIAYKLSCANWQGELAVSDLQVPAAEAVLCVSSLIPAEELAGLIDKQSANLFIIRASRYLDDQNLFNWKNMFLRNEKKNEFSKLYWLFSNFRRKIKRNEKQINEIVANNNFQGQVI